MKKTVLIIPFIIVSLLGCGGEHQHEAHDDHDHSHHHGYDHDHEHDHDHDDHDANEHMNKMSFETLVENFESPEREKWQKPNEVIKLLGEIEGKTIMDIGSGTGYFSFRMADMGAKVISADVDERFLNYIKEKADKEGEENIEIRKTEYGDPLLKENEVDHVIIVNTYHHIHDRVDYFSKVLKGIKKGGSIMVVDFKMEETPQGPPKAHRMPSSKVLAELKKAGFSNLGVMPDMLENQYIIGGFKL
ncbi:MAG: class I SAM-dependent methyltransferase [Bacteroidota bacterium]